MTAPLCLSYLLRADSEEEEEDPQEESEKEDEEEKEKSDELSDEGIAKKPPKLQRMVRERSHSHSYIFGRCGEGEPSQSVLRVNAPCVSQDLPPPVSPLEAGDRGQGKASKGRGALLSFDIL